MLGPSPIQLVKHRCNAQAHRGLYLHVVRMRPNGTGCVGKGTGMRGRPRPPTRRDPISLTLEISPTIT